MGWTAPLVTEDGMGYGECSNLGRWAPDDALGTLNLITAEARLRALALPKLGVVVPLGNEAVAESSRQVPPSLVHAMTALGTEEISSQDIFLISPHGFEMTHLDALGHTNLGGRIYGGRLLAEELGPTGLRHGGVENAGGGIVTRGVLLDVASARGVEYLEQGAGISASDLDAAEEASGARVASGDAVFIRSGLGLRVSRGGVDSADFREGVLPDVLPWLHARDVAIYSGDCIERLPSEVEGLPLPVHQVGMSQMGLWFLDNPDVEALAAACRRYGRPDFLLIVAPLRLRGGTASPINPLAIF